MKLRRTEWISLTVTLLFFLGLAGYHLSARKDADSFSLVPEQETVLSQSETNEADAAQVDETDAETVPDSDGRIDLNTADAALLETLPGIGEVLAQRILAYREDYGGFGSIEEIMNVKGIAEGKFAAIKDLICVSDGGVPD